MCLSADLLISFAGRKPVFRESMVLGRHSYKEAKQNWLEGLNRRQTAVQDMLSSLLLHTY